MVGNVNKYARFDPFKEAKNLESSSFAIAFLSGAIRCTAESGSSGGEAPSDCAGKEEFLVDLRVSRAFRMVSFCGWFKSKRWGRRRQGKEEEMPEGERRTSAAAAPEEEKPKANDHDADEEEEEEEEEGDGEKNGESSPLTSEEEKSEGNGGEGEEEGDGEKKVEEAPSVPLPPAEEKPKAGNGKKAKKQWGKQEKKEEGDGKKSVEPLSPPSREEDTPKGDGEKENRTEEPPSPPMDIELHVPMHCEGCARKVRCILKRYEGVAEVAADWRTQKVVVKGEKASANPLKVVEHLEREINKKVQLLTPLPRPQPGKKKPKAKDQLKKKEEEEEEEEEGKKEEIVASFKLQMHCQACAQKIAKKILKMQGVESAELDWEASKVTVRGVFTAEKLAGYVYKKTMKYVVVTRDQPAAKKVEEEKEGESGGGANLSEEEKEDAIDERKDDEEYEMIGKSSGESEEVRMQATKVAEEEATLKQCCQAYDRRYPPNVCPLFGGGSPVSAQEYPTVAYSHIFSDENPNACSLM